MTRVRLRGIYATALTERLLESEFEIVDPSPVIDTRFGADFDDGEADVTVDMTSDRQGIGISGSADAVDRIAAELESIGIDTFCWEAVAPRGAIFDTEIRRTGRGGGIVDLESDREGYLPFDAADEYLDEGDEVRVQVHEPQPPWATDRPLMDTAIEAHGGLATLVNGVESLVAGTPDGSPEHELARTTELLSTDVPDDWGVRWEYAASDADMEALDAALSKATERATTISAALESGGDSEGALVRPESAAWIWFGRESRFALDDARAAVTETLTGHHRIKAGSDHASSAVDFVEQIGTTEDEFPFEAVTDVFGPGEGDEVTIRHGKPDGRCYTLGRGTVTDRSIEKQRVTVEREMTSRGTYDGLGSDREPGDVAITRFAEGRWWYPTVYRAEDDSVKGTYVNIATPAEVFPTTIRYVDLHVDVLKYPDGSVEIVDEPELEAAVSANLVSEDLAERATNLAAKVASAFEE